jgi:hypothetical protein
LEGPAFTPGAKAIAGALVVAVCVLGAVAMPTLLAGTLDMASALAMAGAFVVVLAFYLAMLTSRTSIDATHIRQRWFGEKKIAIADIAQLKLIHVPGLTWLVAPRLVVRGKGPGAMVFHAASPAVLARFAELAHGPSTGLPDPR